MREDQEGELPRGNFVSKCYVLRYAIYVARSLLAKNYDTLPAAIASCHPAAAPSTCHRPCSNMYWPYFCIVFNILISTSCLNCLY